MHAHRFEYSHLLAKEQPHTRGGCRSMEVQSKSFNIPIFSSRSSTGYKSEKGSSLTSRKSS